MSTTDIEEFQFAFNHGEVEVRPVEENQNATLQGNSKGVDFWVATYVNLPYSLDAPTQEQVRRVATDLTNILRSLSAAAPAVSFEVWVGIGEDAELDEEYES